MVLMARYQRVETTGGANQPHYWIEDVAVATCRSGIPACARLHQRGARRRVFRICYYWATRFWQPGVRTTYPTREEGKLGDVIGSAPTNRTTDCRAITRA